MGQHSAYLKSDPYTSISAVLQAAVVAMHLALCIWACTGNIKGVGAQLTTKRLRDIGTLGIPLNMGRHASAIRNLRLDHYYPFKLPIRIWLSPWVIDTSQKIQK